MYDALTTQAQSPFHVKLDAPGQAATHCAVAVDLRVSLAHKSMTALPGAAPAGAPGRAGFPQRLLWETDLARAVVGLWARVVPAGTEARQR